MTGKATVDRRQLMGGAALLAALIGTPLYFKLRQDSRDMRTASEAQMTMLRGVVDAVIPRTDTPGAAEVGVDAFVALALAHGLEGTLAPSGTSQPNVPHVKGAPPPFGLELLDWLSDRLEREGIADISGAADVAVERAVAAIDAAAFAKGQEASPWRKLKALILLGYYTSEAGATRELRYELVPARWDPDLPATPATRGWSSDWTALTFG